MLCGTSLSTSTVINLYTCTDPESPNFDNDFFFFNDDGIEDPNTAINGPSLACQGNAILLAGR